MFGKWLVLIGIGLVLLGALIWAAGKMGIPFGSLPGDVQWRGENTTFYFPIVTSIVVSILLTILLNVFFRIFK